MSFEHVPRRAIYVIVRHFKELATIEAIGRVIYTNKRRQMIGMYVDDQPEHVANCVAELEALRAVKKVLVSPRPDISDDFSQSHAEIVFDTDDTTFTKGN